MGHRQPNLQASRQLTRLQSGCATIRCQENPNDQNEKADQAERRTTIACSDLAAFTASISRFHVGIAVTD